MHSHPPFLAPKLAGDFPPDFYLLFVTNSNDAANLAAHIAQEEGDRKVSLEKLGDKIFLGQFFYPPQETLR